MLQNKFNNNVALIKEAINNDKLVIFAGAGISKDSGIPLWGELIKNAKNYLNETTKETDSLKIAQILYNEKGEKEYNEIIKELVFKNANQYNPIHEIIFELNPQHIITTNYDMFFESVIKNKGLPFSIVSKDIDLPYAKHKNLLIKYHGDFDNFNVVFKENDYLEFSKNHTLKEIFVKSLFSNKVILFVGYSVSDINLKMLIREIQFLLKKHHQRAYLLNHNEIISDSEIRYFENLGINIINYDAVSLQNTVFKDNGLSDIGKTVYKQLKYIARDFNLFEYKSSLNPSSEKSKIIDDLYESLMRFYYFRVLPRRIIANLYPLNKDSKQDVVNNIRNETLTCFNSDLYELLKNYHGKNDENYSEEEKKKLNYSIGRIIQSGLHHIGKAKQRPNQGYWEVEEKIELYPKIYNDENCDCIDCTLDNFDYPEAIKKIDKYKITDDTSLWEDLTFAYGQYRINDFYNAFQSYKQIDIKANRKIQMDVSFLAKYNMKRLGYMTYRSFDDRYEYDELNSIKKETDNIDLDNEITRVKHFVDEDVYKFLKEVKDGVYIQRLCNEIDDIYLKVPTTVSNIKKGNIDSNSHIYNLYQTATELYRFLNENFILGNGFSAITESFRKSIKTFILGYYLGTLDLAENQKRFGVSFLQSFNIVLFRMIIDYANAKEVNNFILENEMNNIKFGEESLEEVFLWINNFFKSSVEKRTFFNTEHPNEIFISYLKYNRNFNELINARFNIICVIIAYFDFNEYQINELYKNLNSFLKYVDLNRYHDTEFVIPILNNKSKLIDNKLIEETLKIFNEKKLYNSTYNSLINTLTSKNKDFINHDFSIPDFSIDKHWFDYFKIFKSLEQDQKQIFKNKLKDFLMKGIDAQPFYSAIKYKIITDKEVKKMYSEKISIAIQRKIERENSPKTHNDFYILQYYDLVNKKLIPNLNYKELNIQEEHYKFIVDPENYNPKNFKIEWLKIYDWDSFLKRFSKIDYIFYSLEDYLTKRFDKELSKIYFKIKKYQVQ